MRTIIQNSPTGITAKVGMVDLYNPNCMATISQRIMVVDATTSKPLSSAHIAVVGSSAHGTVTNERGFFNPEFLHLQAGQSVAISHLGYVSVTLTQQQLRSASVIELQPSVEQLPEVTLTPNVNAPSNNNQATSSNTQAPSPKVTQEPSNNHRVQLSSQWLWWAAALIVGGAIYYTLGRKPKPKKVTI